MRVGLGSVSSGRRQETRIYQRAPFDCRCPGDLWITLGNERNSQDNAPSPSHPPILRSFFSIRGKKKMKSIWWVFFFGCVFFFSIFSRTEKKSKKNSWWKWVKEQFNWEKNFLFKNPKIK
jgi:hypothetical protein